MNMRKHKNIVYPIKGEFCTLIELSRLTNTSYSNLFFYQQEINLLPQFRIEGKKFPRYKQAESIQTINTFLAMRKAKKGTFKNFLQELKDEMLKDVDYIRFCKLAEQHRKEINKNKKYRSWKMRD